MSHSHPSSAQSVSGPHLADEDAAILAREEATAARVGSAATCIQSAPPGTCTLSEDGTRGVYSPNNANRPLGLPPRTPMMSSATASPRGNMPGLHARRNSGNNVEEDGTGLDYPVGEEELAQLRAKRTLRNPSYAHIFPQDKWPGYRPIEEHGLIGNMHTCAVVSTDAEISWFCYPHFDSPSIFASLLDSEKGGRFAIRAAVEHGHGAPNVTHRQLYHSETNVLISRFLTDSGVGQVIDYMPVGKACREGHGWLMRELECVRGKMYFSVECEPAFNYGRDPHEVQIVTHGARFKSEKLSMVLTSSKKRTWTVTARNGVQTKLKLVEGQKAVFIFRESKSPAAYPNEDPTKHDTTGHPATEELTEHLKVSTIDFWRQWISKCTYTGRWREAVYRSALVLKLLTFEPTGAIVAAPTTSLPEGVGGTRNWDYRFAWIRDSSFVLYAFIKLGFREEAAAFMGWIAKRCEESSKGDGSLQIMYGLHGEHKLEELELDHLNGYMDSRPVRIGNGAYDQVQLDIYGELLDTVYLSNKYAEPISYEFWLHVRKMVDWICEHWQESDEGIWEVRGGQQHFVYSKVMSWVALDRGIRLAERRSFPADLPRWYQVRNTIYEEIQEKGFNKERNAFVQHYGSDTLDASVLIMPLVFFMSPTDPRFVSTLDAILASTADDGLVSNNLVFRYNVEHTQDGLVGEEGTFSICTFWAVEAAARLGMYKKKYLEKARLMFEQMLGYANHCLKEGTRVYRADGTLVAVECVSAGDVLLGQDGRRVLVSRVASRVEEAGVLRVQHTKGRSYECSPGHLVTLRWAQGPSVQVVDREDGAKELRVSYVQSREAGEAFLQTKALVWRAVEDESHTGPAVQDDRGVLRGSLSSLLSFGHAHLASLPRSAYLSAGELVDVPAEEVYKRRHEWRLGTTEAAAAGRRVPVPAAEQASTVGAARGDARVLYQLPGDSAMGLAELEPVLEALDLDKAGAAVCVLSASDEEAAAAEVLQALDRQAVQTIVAFGSHARSSWQSALTTSRVTRLARWESVTDSDVQGVRLSFESGRALQVWFAPSPCDWSRLAELGAALSLAHGLSLSSSELSSRIASVDSLPIKSIEWRREATRVVTIDLKGERAEDRRFVIEGGQLTHNCGLYSEEIGKRGEHLGNFPQAFTHLALISAAINLDKALNFHRGGGNFLSSTKEEVSSSSRKPVGNPQATSSQPASGSSSGGPHAPEPNRKPVHIASQDETSTARVH